MVCVNGFGSWFDRARIISAFCKCFWSVAYYVVRIGDALSQLLNVVVFFGTNPNESVSGRAYRLQKTVGWKQLRIVIDVLFSFWEDNHCELSYNADLARAFKLIDEQ